MATLEITTCILDLKLITFSISRTMESNNTLTPLFVLLQYSGLTSVCTEKNKCTYMYRSLLYFFLIQNV